MVKTAIWVQARVLEKAIHSNNSKSDAAAAAAKSVVRKDTIDLDRSGKFGWICCELISGDISALGDPLNVRVFDDQSPLHGQVISIDAGDVQTPAEGGSSRVLMANEWAAAELTAGSAGANKLGLPPDDLITLTHLHEPAVVYSLRKRYEENIIYTATGPILIALNPFKALPDLYNDEMMNNYWMAGEGLTSTAYELQPHIYRNAHQAFRAMMQGIDMMSSGLSGVIVDQSMLVSGESGAGKTVTTKHVMNYLASLSQRKAKFSERRRDASPGRSEPRGPRRASSLRASRAMSWKAGALVEERILESNPILEAFGNARTVRNDNSSRFGKFIELQFKKTGSLVGASIETYLLEKVRLVHQSEGERNFHVFYGLVKAAMDDEREMFMLGDYSAQDFKMTSSSGTYDRRDGVDDEELYDELVMALSTMGFERDTMNDIFCCTAAFLHAYNLTFTSPTEESSRVDDSNPHLEPTLKLLGLNKDAFNSAITEYELEIGKQTFTRQLTAEGAQKALEAFIKGTYGALFDFIVSTVNKRIDYKPARGVPNILGKAASISVLDIFGFESFQSNSFEQLCINYCNEALQQQFNLFIFKNEQVEYQREGIRWDFIDFPDNSEVIELIEKKGTGILSILTDQCRQPRTTDRTFVEALYKACEKHDRFILSPLHKGKGQFIISHYAGAVMYDADGFLEKNKDETPRGASDLLEASEKPFVQLLGNISRGVEASSQKASGSRSSKKRPTVGSQFSSQLTDLRNRIDQTKPHYIRCLKPNQSLQPNDFEKAMIADQLRYAGVLEAIRVSRVGFSQRYAHDNFLDRYRFIALDAVSKAAAEKRVDVLLKEVAIKLWKEGNPNKPLPGDALAEAGIQKGVTKIFLRQSAFDNMEKLRNDALTESAVKTQKVARRFIFRCRYIRKVECVVKVQASGRRFLARKYLIVFKQTKSATKIQATGRSSLARRRFKANQNGCISYQKVARAYLGRKIYKVMHARVTQERQLTTAATTIQCQFRILVARRVHAHLLSLGRRPSVEAAKLEGRALKAALKADRAAAITRQNAQDRKREVDTLTKELGNANYTAEKAKETEMELVAVKAELEAALAELEETKEKLCKASKRADVLEQAKTELQEKIQSGVFLSGEPYISRMYADYPDLEGLDMGLYNLKAQSKKGKNDLKSMLDTMSLLT